MFPDQEVGICPRPGCDGVLCVFDAQALLNRQQRGIDTPEDTRPRCSVCDYVAPETGGGGL